MPNNQKDKGFHFKVIRTCQHFHRRYYYFEKESDHALIQALSEFGAASITEFSKYSPAANDMFKIAVADELEFSGCIGVTEMYVTIRKSRTEKVNRFEDILSDWSQSA